MGFDITGLGSVFDFAGKVIDKIFPDKDAADRAKLEMLKLQQVGEFKEIEAEWDNMKAQIAINVEEAKHPSLFVSGGRPAAMWVCVVGLFYTFIAQPLLSWAAILYNKAVPPEIDTTLLMQLLFGMLGLAGMRSWEKNKRVARK